MTKINSEEKGDNELESKWKYLLWIFKICEIKWHILFLIITKTIIFYYPLTKRYKENLEGESDMFYIVSY